MKFRLPVFSILFLFSAMAYSRVQVQVKDQSRIYNLQTQEEVKLVDRTFFIDDINQIYWVTSEGKVPVIILPVNDSTSRLDLNSPLIENQMMTATKNTIDLDLSKIMVEVIEIQKYLSQGRENLARTNLSRLMKERPDLEFLHFLSASVSLLSGDKKMAIEELERGLAIHPEYQDGKEMLKKLKGSK